METKLEYMQRNLNELDVALTDVTTKALHIADELALDVDDDAGPFEVIQELRKQVRIGQEYTKPYSPKRIRMGAGNFLAVCPACGRVRSRGGNLHNADCYLKGSTPAQEDEYVASSRERTPEQVDP